MKPTEADVKWCVDNAEFVNGLLEKRGGWQEGDWCVSENPKYPHPWLVFDVNWAPGIGEAIWLPSVDDVLGMLEERTIANIELWKAPLSDGYLALPMGRRSMKASYGDTRLIALLELLKTVEGKG